MKPKGRFVDVRSYRLGKRHLHSAKFWLLAVAVAALLLITAVGVLRAWYTNNLRPISSSTSTKYFTVETGSGVHQIAVDLRRADLIRNTQAFETYVRSNELHDKLQAGTYSLSPSLSVQQIVDKMVRGEVAKNLVTVLPGKRLDQVKKAFLKAGYSQPEVDVAFNSATYIGHPVLASLPSGASLEGFLYPDSFQKDSNTPAQVIIRESLDEMQKHLTPDITAGFVAQNLSVFQGVTLASIVEQESGDPAGQPTVAQVFLSRQRQNMPLGSDVTAFYASAVAGQPPSVTIESPYNTRLHPGFPPGPIGSVTNSALQAVAHPSTSTYLYFVAGDDGKLHFSHTQAEHEAAIAQYCKKSCGP